MNEHETARLIYLGLLLVFVTAGIWVTSRRNVGKTVQQVLVWVGIFCLFMIIYAERGVLVGQLFPSAGRQIDDTTIALNRSASGSFEATLTVNGEPVRFLVDTGATDIVLSRSDAQRVGIDTDRLTFLRSAITANGRVDTATVLLNEVSFAGLIDRDVPASVTAGDLGFSLLGMSYLDRFKRIEIEGDRMMLVRP